MIEVHPNLLNAGFVVRVVCGYNNLATGFQ
jgi:hypothetical protein